MLRAVGSLPQDDSDMEDEPPAPPPPRQSQMIDYHHHRTPSGKLLCIGRQDEYDESMVRGIEGPLQFVRAQALAVAGMSSDGRRYMRDFHAEVPHVTQLPLARDTLQSPDIPGSLVLYSEKELLCCALVCLPVTNHEHICHCMLYSRSATNTTT